MNFKTLFAFAGLLMICSCHEASKNDAQKTDILRSHLDTTVKPGDDFFAYANGGWIKNNPIPADETNWGIGELVQRELYEKLKKINESCMSKTSKMTTEKQIGDFWFSAMDTASIEKNGFGPLTPELNSIIAIKTTDQLVQQAAKMHTYGASVFFDEGVAQDQKNSNVEAYYLTQGGLGLPIRDYYFNTDARTVKIREAYPAYVAQIFRLMGVDSISANKKAAEIMTFETKLAAKSRKLEDLRDEEKNYNKYAIADLKKISPDINWTQCLAIIGVKNIDSVIVGQPEFFVELNKLVKTTDLQTLKDYMAFHLIATFASYLSKPFEEANFNFYAKTIRGAQEQHPRWRRTLDAEERAIGEELGQIFVKEYFSDSAKVRYEQIVENVRNAYKARMGNLTWMDDSTKQKAINKLVSIKRKVGYPEKWKDFSSMKIDKGPYVLNMMHANEWWNNYSLNKLGKPVDRNEWDMTPQTYNAYYNQSNNEIVLPAAQMTVPGFKDNELDDALVYGYTAASTIGHEITHGFDDQGRKYDKEGNLKNWWSAKDSFAFVKRADVLVQQFSGMTPLDKDTLHVNGKASLGENLADLGGILIGLDAFKQSNAYKKGTSIGGLTPMQRFFLGYALGWMMEERQERMASQLLTDVHAPAKCRVNGPLPNVPEFYEAFNVRPGDKLYIPDSMRVHLW